MKKFNKVVNGYTVNTTYADDCYMCVNIYNDDISIWYSEDGEHYSSSVEFYMGYEEVTYTTLSKFDGETGLLFRDTIAECVALAMVKAKRQVIYNYEYKHIQKVACEVINMLVH